MKTKVPATIYAVVPLIYACGKARCQALWTVKI